MNNKANSPCKSWALCIKQMQSDTQQLFGCLKKGGWLSSLGVWGLDFK